MRRNVQAFKHLVEQQSVGVVGGRRLFAHGYTFNILPYINTALTGANPTVPQSRRRKSPAAWDSRKMTLILQRLRDRCEMEGPADS